MNCHEFNESLYDYLDGTLSPESQQAAREHLRSCASCQRALQREEASAQFLNQSLTRATAALSFRGIASARPVSRRPSLLAAVRLWFSSHAWSTAIVTVVILGVALFAFRSSHHPAAPARAQLNQFAGGSIAVIDVPIQITTHSFRQQDGTVMDALAPTLAYARFP